MNNFIYKFPISLYGLSPQQLSVISKLEKKFKKQKIKYITSIDENYFYIKNA